MSMSLPVILIQKIAVHLDTGILGNDNKRAVVKGKVAGYGQNSRVYVNPARIERKWAR